MAARAATTGPPPGATAPAPAASTARRTEHSRRRQHAERSRDERGANEDPRQETDVDQRVGERELAAKNVTPTASPARMARRRARSRGRRGNLLEAEDDGEQGSERHGGAGHVEPTGLRVAKLRAGRAAPGPAASPSRAGPAGTRSPTRSTRAAVRPGSDRSRCRQRSRRSTRRSPWTLSGIAEHAEDQGQGGRRDQWSPRRRRATRERRSASRRSSRRRRQTEATLKKAAPISSSRRRPMRSPSVPMVISDPATRKP